MAGDEMLSGSVELLPDLGMIVNFAIVHDGDARGFIPHGLAAVGKIHDAQAAVSEMERPVDENIAVVGPSVAQGLGHAADVVG